MASKVAVGIMRETAVKTLESAMRELFGEGFVLPTQGRDPALLHAQQLEAIATFLQCKVEEKSAAMEYAPPEGTVATTVAVPDDVVITPARRNKRK